MHNNNNIYVCNGKQADHNLVILVKFTNLPKQIPLQYFVLYGIHVKHALNVPLPTERNAAHSVPSVQLNGIQGM